MTTAHSSLSRMMLICSATLAMMLVHDAVAAPKTVSGRVSRVTLYRSQAMVTRTIPVEGEKGSIEVVVGGLPARIVPDSLFAEAGEGIEIRAVRFRSRAVGQEPREEVRKLDEAAQQVKDQLTLASKRTALLAKRAAYLDKLEGFVAPTAKTELSKGVLDAEALERITIFAFTQRQEIASGQMALEKEARQLKNQLSLLQRKRAELTGRASRTQREAVLFLEKRGAAAETVRLNYLVGDCGWSPTYTFRADKAGKQVQVQYNGLIHQRTGESWHDVALTLSTASVALSAAGPGLAPFHVTLNKGGGGKIPGQPGNQQQLAKRLKGYQREQQAANIDNRSTLNLAGNIDSAWRVNTAANSIQDLELNNSRELLLSFQSNENEQGPSLSYKLAGNVSLASRADQQMVRILKAPLASRFYHVATPVLTSYVYREADVTNNSPQDLLAGPITVYLDGRFVGRGEIPTVTRGQSFVIGFGADPQLRARRELAGKTDRVQGGNRELAFKYRLVIENYNQQAAPIRVFDRLPHSGRAADIRVTLADMKDKLSTDKLYVRRELPKGLLRWEIEVPAGATGEKARLIEYGYKVEFDRNFILTAAAAGTQQQMKEFDRLQRGRLRY